MSEFTLAVKPRTVTGKKVKRLRRDGIVPGIIYGQQEPIAIQIDNLEARRILRRADSNTLITLDIDGKSRTTLVRDIQQHITRGDLIHIDFYEINMTEEVKTEASLRMVGIAAPQDEGLGNVTLMLQSVEISALPGDLVSEFVVDATLIDDPNKSIYVSDLDIPQNITLLTSPETLVATFSYVSQVEEEEEEELLDEEAVEGEEVAEEVDEEDEG